MKKTLILAVALGFSAVGCNSSNDSQPTAAPVADSQSWKLTLNSQCADGTAAENCVANYGFSVMADGSYQVGPGPQGQVVRGKLSRDEFNPLSDELKAIKAEQGETCVQADANSGEESLVLTRGTRVHTVLHQANTDLCYRAASADDAQNVRTTMAQLASRYYPAVFPDACLDAAQKYEASYAGVQNCMKDADCGFVGDSFDPILAGNVAFVITDNCSKVTPLAVGNLSQVAMHQSQLAKGLAQVQQSCGQNLQRSDCSQVSGFQSTDAVAVCRQQVCQINSSAGH